MNRLAVPQTGSVLLVALAIVACGDRMAIRGGADETRATTTVIEAGDDPAGDESALRALHGLGYAKGSEDAPVIVVEFSDFGCPYCARFALETLPAVEREFIESGQVRWQYVPAVLGSFPNGVQAAITAECAADQGRFWEMHDLLYERQMEWRSGAEAAPLFGSYARLVGLDLEQFAACYAENRPAARLEANGRAAAALGVTGTPSFYVNGRPVQGAVPLEQFRTYLQWAGAESR